MTPAVTRIATALAVVLSLAGCATIATHDEYRAYRAIREASDDDTRLTALAHYAQTHPNGQWAQEVRDERSNREGDVWSGHNATREGLQYYLAAYPDGTYVEQAQQRLAALEVVGGRREEEAQHVEEVQAVRRADAAEERRLWVTRSVEYWARTLLGIRNYGQTISQVARANPEFSQAFGQAPAPFCTPQSCLKHYHAHYAIPVPGATRIERQMHVFLRILLDHGRVERVEVLLPNKGFSRWFELENRTLITDEDPEQRMQAIEWALQHLEPIITQVATGARVIDVVPEPIAPISQAAQAASQHAEEGDDAPAPAASEPATPTPTPPAGGQTQPGGGGLDTLLEQAVGSPEQAPAGEQPAQTEEPPPDMASLVLPMGLRALQRGNVRIVVFAAGDEDYGEAYDGFYIERVRD